MRRAEKRGAGMGQTAAGRTGTGLAQCPAGQADALEATGAASQAPDMTRRQFVAGTAGGLAAAALALAGCGSSSQGQAGGTDGSAGGDAGQDASAGQEGADGGTADGAASAGGSDLLTAPLDNGYGSGKHHATLVVRNFGTIKLELNADVAPITVSNFAQLATDGFYNGLTFHRIIKGFMIQGGDPKGDGSGGSDRRIKGEFMKNGIQNVLQHKRGVISMARSNDANSASSQFFIMQADNASLDGSYAAFGKVTEGLEVVDAIAEVPVQDDNGTVAAADQPVIESLAMDD